MFYDASQVKDVFKLLHEHDIEYILLKNIDDELPCKLKIGKDIDILVHPECWQKFLKLMPEMSYVELVHPHGEKAGWKFLYGMDSCHQFEHLKSGVQIDAYAQLATKSIGMNAWLPLDKTIQVSIWKDKVWEDKKQWWQMDDKNLLVYLVTRSVFEKEAFTPVYVKELEKLKFLLEESKEEIEEKFSTIFFKFTPTLMNLLKERKYDEIRMKYLAFSDY